MKNIKPVFGFAIAILFITLGFNLIQKEDTLAVFFGYANIFFWLAIIIFSIYKKATSKK